jgi:hypothetical protein
MAADHIEVVVVPLPGADESRNLGRRLARHDRGQAAATHAANFGYAYAHCLLW